MSNAPRIPIAILIRRSNVDEIINVYKQDMHNLIKLKLLTGNECPLLIQLLQWRTSILREELNRQKVSVDVGI